MKKIVKKIVKKIFFKILASVKLSENLSSYIYTLTEQPIADANTYIKLAQEAQKNTFSFYEVGEFEKTTGISINKDWLNQLGLLTQVVIKKSPLNYAHGRVLYSALRQYLKHQVKDSKSVNIIETGTARGYSSLCMAKALFDEGYEGQICTIDLLPHKTKMYWNCISDHYHGPLSRSELLRDWSDLVERYILFVQGSSKQMMPKLSFSRVHFAFLDAAHTYEDVMFEFSNISQLQIKGDMVIFDDYNSSQFPGVFKAINYIGDNLGYNLQKILNSTTNRGYVIATKL